MSKSRDDSSPPASPGHVKRERSTRYPGVHLAEALKLCESIDELGLDGLMAADIASALGYKNIKTNTFSARLSAAAVRPADADRRRLRVDAAGPRDPPPS